MHFPPGLDQDNLISLFINFCCFITFCTISILLSNYFGFHISHFLTVYYHSNWLGVHVPHTSSLSEPLVCFSFKLPPRSRPVGVRVRHSLQPRTDIFILPRLPAKTRKSYGMETLFELTASNPLPRSQSTTRRRMGSPSIIRRQPIERSGGAADRTQNRHQ